MSIGAIHWRVSSLQCRTSCNNKPVFDKTWHREGRKQGVCVSRSSGCCAGTFNSGNLCPGDNDIQCCYNAPCTTSHGGGTCMQTSLCSSQGGVSDSGNYCDGPADLQCCVKGGSGKISRDEIISRAQNWVDRAIPYSQSATTGTILQLQIFSKNCIDFLCL
jgi:hypothetical protein